MMLSRQFVFVVGLLGGMTARLQAETLHVPTSHKTIQAAIAAAKPGDTIVVEPGTYSGPIRLGERLTLKSVGDDSTGKYGLKRAEATIIDGGGSKAAGPAVVMAAGAVLDGFSVTRVGVFDQKEYDLHHATYGELLPDERGAVGVKDGFPALAIADVTATVRHCIVHDNGNAGIGASGKGNSSHVYRNVVFRNMGGGIGVANRAEPTVEENRCFNNLRGGIGNRNSKAAIVNNECFDNVRAGIGIREGATPLVRGNKCYNNRRAGIGVRMAGTNPIIENNECHGNEMAGIGNRDGAAPVIRNNRCYRNQMAGIGSRDGARGIIESNECFENEMAGIGSRNGAAPTIRFNKCYKNRMAGIGCRDGARPIIEGNECYENEMAGIGARDDAAPIIRANKCYQNEMAGIGSRLHARAIILDNDCYENRLAGIGAREGAMPIITGNRCYRNELAGIGSRDGAYSLIESNECKENKLAGIGVRNHAVVMLLHNKCLENGLVAIGLRHGSAALIIDNELVRTGGMPPVIAVREGSTALIAGNTIRGGGVAGILVDGAARIRGNDMKGMVGKSGSAVWGWGKADLTIIGNNVDGYRNLISNPAGKVVVADNIMRNFQGPAITIKNSLEPAHVSGNIAISENSKDKVFVLDGPQAKLQENLVQQPNDKDVLRAADEQFWTLARKQAKFEREPGEQTITEGAWKLVIRQGKTTTGKLYHLANDPQASSDVAAQFDTLVLRLRGRLERQEAAEYKLMVRKEGSGK